ncbi:ABC transporter permease subunit [Streptomonospora sp. S1-112]|uniref:ABC transporter permease subunit n=1 Tax=Streptomonospora mangrovi TaxID=2883123 RepID=A0A9X3NQ98_9ACTN|nr:ABC transporter permease subunit [Streptomonospora mangrovi]MDA0567904.1 ABC transporter permease subunit [Streptomonospora mangrovi]
MAGMLPGAVAAEWSKARTTWSTHAALLGAAVAVAAVVLIGVAAVNTWEGLPAARRDAMVVAPLDRVVVLPLSIALGVLGVLTMTREYTTGMIRVSLAAVPHRGAVLAAKALVVAAITLVAGVAGVGATSLLTRWAAGDRPLGFNSLPLDNEIPVVLAQGVSVMVIALAALGAATLLRSTAASIAALVAVVFLAPTIARNLPDPWADRLSSVLPGNLPYQVVEDTYTGHAFEGVLPPWAAAALMAGYALVPLLAGALALYRRDA